jgi:hypothetical protein
MTSLDTTISRMLSEYTGDAVIEPSEFDGDLSRCDTRRFMARSLAAAAVALGFMGALFWTLSAPTSSPSLIGTGATATLGDTAPVPAFSQEMR